MSVEHVEPIDLVKEEFVEEYEKRLAKVVYSDVFLAFKLVELIEEADDELAEKYRKKISKNMKRAVRELLTDILDIYDEPGEIIDGVLEKYKDTLECKHHTIDECREIYKNAIEEIREDPEIQDKEEAINDLINDCLSEQECEFPKEIHRKMLDEAVQKTIEWIRSR